MKIVRVNQFPSVPAYKLLNAVGASKGNRIKSRCPLLVKIVHMLDLQWKNEFGMHKKGHV